MNSNAFDTRGRSRMLSVPPPSLCSWPVRPARPKRRPIASRRSGPQLWQREEGVRSLRAKWKASLDELEMKEDLKGMTEVSPRQEQLQDAPVLSGPSTPPARTGSILHCTGGIRAGGGRDLRGMRLFACGKRFGVKTGGCARPPARGSTCISWPIKV